MQMGAMWASANVVVLKSGGSIHPKGRSGQAGDHCWTTVSPWSSQITSARQSPASTWSHSMTRPGHGPGSSSSAATQQWRRLGRGRPLAIARRPPSEERRPQQSRQRHVNMPTVLEYLSGTRAAVPVTSVTPSARSPHVWSPTVERISMTTDLPSTETARARLRAAQKAEARALRDVEGADHIRQRVKRALDEADASLQSRAARAGSRLGPQPRSAPSRRPRRQTSVRHARKAQATRTAARPCRPGRPAGLGAVRHSVDADR